VSDLKRRSKDDQIVYWQDKWAESRGEIERLSAENTRLRAVYEAARRYVQPVGTYYESIDALRAALERSVASTDKGQGCPQCGNFSYECDVCGGKPDPAEQDQG